MDVEEDDGMESFDINERDLEYALNPGYRRGLSKNQQLYGIWADREESDSEDTHAGFGSKGSKKQSKNYSAPVTFVSGGIKHGNKIEKENKDDDDDAVDDEPISVVKPRRASRRQAGANVFAGLRLSSTHSVVDPDKFADWAKHSKSDVIMKMMRKMGYVPGQGLGANKQGIVEPIQAVLRPGRAAVGAYGRESKGPNFGESAGETQKRIESSKDDEKIEEPTRRGNWKKTGSKKNVKYQYKTIDEVLAEGGPLKQRLMSANSGVKVIDMTGKEQKVYSGYDAYAAKTRAVAEARVEHLAFDVPELMHNLNLLINETEETIRQNDRQMRFLRDQTTALENDLVQIQSALWKECQEQKRVEELSDLLERFSTKSEEGNVTLNECRELFQKMQTEYFEEYRLFRLEEIAIASVLPLIQHYFLTWNAFDDEQMNYGIALMSEWKRILEIEQHSIFNVTRSLENLSPFERLLWDGWMPVMRKTALRWNPRDDPQSMLHVVEKWLPLLPLWMRENLLEQIIIPRIAAEVDEWNPLTDHIPIHTWLHPWLDVMGDRLQPIFSPIRQKLAKALKEWNPTDRSALSMLRPWKGCFASATMSAFLAMNITPKLEKALQEMVYDPTKNHRYDEFYAVLDWIELIGAEGIAAVLVRSFFPKWYETLCIWLESPRVVPQEVVMWYNQWKTRFPVEISSLVIIQEQLKRALIAMKNAQQGVHLTKEIQPPLPPPEPASGMYNPAPPRIQPPPPHLSFKDLVELRAREAGILYVPQLNKFREGKRVYWFGNVSIYIDRNVIFGFNVETQQWSPIGLDHLLSIC
uniref:G-patch domain-containing protein n=1 Tax=Onchocerca volvulus TaxID=6282 RepID=A0A2K6VEC1_ONCVO